MGKVRMFIVTTPEPIGRRKRRYRSSLRARANAAARRSKLRQLKLCINGSKHGPATHGCRCRHCYEVHSGKR